MFGGLEIGKRFARVLILGFVAYYIIWFGVIPILGSIRDRMYHFIKLLIYVDLMSTCLFYVGIFNSIWAFVHGKFKK
jgi:hypothetical protein